jgi:hypothetical protein
MLTGAELEMLAEVMKDQADAAILEAARKGDLGALRDLHRLLDRKPEVWRAFGDAARVAEHELLDLFAGPCLLTLESVRRRLAELKAELAEGDESPLVRLSAERVALCWLAAADADKKAAVTATSPAAQAAARRWQSESQRRLDGAIRSLATLKKLLRPALSPLELARRAVPESDDGRVTARLRRRAACAAAN